MAQTWRIPGLFRFLVRNGRELLRGEPANGPHPSHLRALPGPAPDPLAVDLTRKLWGGFARHALRDLDEVVRTSPAEGDRVFAAWELAKYHAAGARWEEVLKYLKIIRAVESDFLRRKEGGLLYIEALTALGRPQDAARYVRRKVDKSAFGADYACALSNVIAAGAERRAGIGEQHLTRLALLNGLYRKENLAEVGLVDQSRGFVFDNLAVAECRLSAVHRPEKISVLLTVYNAEQFLSIAVSSVLSQTWRNLELIIVDDASTDDSWKLVERLAIKDPRIVAVRNAVRMGRYEARNRALSLVTGDFVSVHDSHAWAHPQILQLQAEATLADSEVKLTFSGATCVSLDMEYALRVEENGPEYLHTSGQSLFIGTRDLHCLHKWDGVREHADEELLQRAMTIWGDQSARDILPNVPMTLRLEIPDAEKKHRSLRSGVRQEYLKQAAFWRQSILVPARDAGQTLPLERVSTKQPFPIPGCLAPTHRTRHYDLIIISDLALLGGTRRCNEGYIAAATSLGMKVGLLHWARYDLKLKDDIAKEYRFLSYGENVDILTADDRVTADLVLIHHPPIMKYLPDDAPKIQTKWLAILVNQLPSRALDEGKPYYERSDVEADCLKLFGMRPVWIPISPVVRRVLSEEGFEPLAKEDWIPPLGEIVIVDSNARSTMPHRNRSPVVGRHSRDHWTKWPEDEKDLRSAYCADSKLSVRLLGGARSARRVLSRWPENWEELAFDSMPVKDFLNDLDFFVHYTHSGYIEEFGRNIMEAIAAGVPAIVPPRFREVFGDAACYAEPQRVEELIYKLWDTKSAYVEQVDKGFHFVGKFASNERVERRLKEAIHGTI